MELERLLGGLRAVAEPSRLRLLAICAEGEWTVSELVQVLGQSQPRVSRHLRLLADAGLLERFREGSWVFYRRARRGSATALARSLDSLLPADDPQLALDRSRLAAVREARRHQVERWFDRRAADWDSERDLGGEGARVEAVLQQLFAARRPSSLLDIGTGTGRILELLAPHVREALGVDISRDMLSVARANLDRRSLRHCSVRQADMYRLPIADASFAAVTLHQVLHFADDPLRVLAEARRVLEPGGLLVVVDLDAHQREELRSQRRHRRLGFTGDEMSAWFTELALREEPPVRLAGRELTSVIWIANVPTGEGTGRWAQRRREAA